MPKDLTASRPRRPAYFWWFVANCLALCFAVMSWVFCLQVFGNPEVPRNYRILQAIGRAPEFKLYPAAKVPNGDAWLPKEVYSRCIPMSQRSLTDLNHALLRNYLMRCANSKMLKLLEGRFRIEAVRKLGAGDFLSHGLGIRMVALEQPDEFTPPAAFPVMVDLLVPTEADPTAIKVGTTLQVARKPHAIAVVHVDIQSIHDDPTVCVTSVPIAAGKLPIGGSGSSPIAVAPHGLISPGPIQPLF